jgi:hypothetical protein
MLAAGSTTGVWLRDVEQPEAQRVAPSPKLFPVNLSDTTLALWTAENIHGLALVDTATLATRSIVLDTSLDLLLSFSTSGNELSFASRFPSANDSEAPVYRAYVLDTRTEELTLLHHPELEDQVFFARATISGNGGYVAFSSPRRQHSPDQVEQPYDGAEDLFLYDRQHDSVDFLGRGVEAVLDEDASTVAIWSPDANPNAARIRVLHRPSGRSHNACVVDETPLRTSCADPVLSDDGRLLAFRITLSGGTLDSSPWRCAIAVFDRDTGKTTLLEETKTIGQGCPTSWTLSGDGRVVAFSARSSEDLESHVFVVGVPSPQ